MQCSLIEAPYRGSFSVHAEITFLGVRAWLHLGLLTDAAVTFRSARLSDDEDHDFVSNSDVESIYAQYCTMDSFQLREKEHCVLQAETRKKMRMCSPAPGGRRRRLLR